eukprot:CAMPEP_0179920552 /NCGR_PEP_ID=MMETSP0983-20121128/4566_1 /TAXON_ID=483367 /ORGANISM="non described non described, Strain CCMP 2436" /LENGTH=62 /DNA_ID=CAMNT_0021823639 /DNA_START=76 /DNA_END=261 /DNA_ORIENTATION=+
MEKQGLLPLHDACEDGDVLLVRTLLEAWDANIADADGYTALMVASEYGHIECARLLLEAGAD